MGRVMAERGKPPECHPERPYFSAGLCEPCYQKKRRDADPALTRQRHRKYENENRHKVREFQRRYAYGIEPHEYEALLAAQEGRCAICQREKNLCVDHCHVTGQIRFLLCKICNVAVGLAENSPTFVSNLSDYVAMAEKLRAEDRAAEALLAFDPGNRTGWAKFVGQELHSAGLLKAGRPELGLPQRVVIEVPRWYPHEHKVDVNDLLDLGQKAGWLKGFYEDLGAETEYVYPRTWKGTVPKDIHNERVLQKLSSAELSVLQKKPRATKFDHNMVDAVGIGLWKLGRM